MKYMKDRFLICSKLIKCGIYKPTTDTALNYIVNKKAKKKQQLMNSVLYECLNERLFMVTKDQI